MIELDYEKLIDKICDEQLTILNKLPKTENTTSDYVSLLRYKPEYFFVDCEDKDNLIEYAKTVELDQQVTKCIKSNQEYCKIQLQKLWDKFSDIIIFSLSNSIKKEFKNMIENTRYGLKEILVPELTNENA
jgi:hypothetical protein